jgi:hypothetical protein
MFVVEVLSCEKGGALSQVKETDDAQNIVGL